MSEKQTISKGSFRGHGSFQTQTARLDLAWRFFPVDQSSCKVQELKLYSVRGMVSTVPSSKVISDTATYT